MPTAAQPLIDTLSGDMPDLLRPIKVQKRCASAGLPLRGRTLAAILHRLLPKWTTRAAEFFDTRRSEAGSSCGRATNRSRLGAKPQGSAPDRTNPLQPAISSTRSWMSKPTGAGRNSKSRSIRQAGSPLHTASSASLIYSRKPIKPAHAAILRFSQQWPFTAHGNHPEQTPRRTRRRSSAFKRNSTLSSCYQATRSEKKELNFIRSFSSASPKNTGGTRASRTNSARKKIDGGFFKLRLTVKAKEAHPPSNPSSILKVLGWCDTSKA